MDEDFAADGQSNVRHRLGLFLRRSPKHTGRPVLRCPACGMEVVLTDAARLLVDQAALQCPSRSCRYTFVRAWHLKPPPQAPHQEKPL